VRMTSVATPDRMAALELHKAKVAREPYTWNLTILELASVVNTERDRMVSRPTSLEHAKAIRANVWTRFGLGEVFRYTLCAARPQTPLLTSPQGRGEECVPPWRGMSLAAADRFWAIAY
jgi:hypothetical protein